MLLVGVGAAVVAWPIGMIAMRTRADVFAIVTITLLFVAQTFAFNLKSITGGAQGAGVSLPPFPVATFERPFYYAASFLLLLAMAIAYLMSRTKIGLALAAIRADEDKARGIGVRTTGVKLMAFCVSVGITAVAGGIWAYYIGFIYPQFAIDPLLTIAIVLMTFLGGRATLWGPVLGAAILMPSQQLLAYYVGGSRLYLIGYAAIFLLIMLLLPRGILPTLQHRRRQSSLASRRDSVDPRPDAPAGISPPPDNARPGALVKRAVAGLSGGPQL
jgi:branched-chain amino acid transport system permease protein